MRRALFVIGAAAVASCNTLPPQPPARAAQAEERFQQLIAGKIAQAPVSCMPTRAHSDMIVIDENRIAFRTGANRVYVAHMEGGCSGLTGSEPYALVTRQIGSSGYCQGDIANVVDTLNRFTVASCVFGQFTPYVRAP